MDMEKVAIVLSHPENSKNVGAVCRAMATMDVSDLRIVGERRDYDSGKVSALALHAKDVWQAARFFGSITSAVSDCAISIATTRRRGKKRKAFMLFPEEAAEKAGEVAARGGRSAVVFGNERTGLTDSEMNECTTAMTIPSSRSFPSLNLSHAVQVTLYTLFRNQCKGSKGYSTIELKRLERVIDKIAECFAAIGFFSTSGESGKEEAKRFWREVLSRSALSEGEAKYMEHIFEKARGMSNKNNPPPQ